MHEKSNIKDVMKTNFDIMNFYMFSPLICILFWFPVELINDAKNADLLTILERTYKFHWLMQKFALGVFYTLIYPKHIEINWCKRELMFIKLL